MPTISDDQALKNARGNDAGVWNRSPGIAVRSGNAADASNRIWDGYANVRPEPPRTKLKRDNGVYTMGSCFARSIEKALIQMGGNVVSMSQAVIDHPAFRDNIDNAVVGCLNRFTPGAMLHEFKMAFNRLPGWDHGASLIFKTGPATFDDLNYWSIRVSDQTSEAIFARRAIAYDLVRTAAHAQAIVLTLGLTESWFHIPSGFHVNRINPAVVKRNPGDFRLDFARSPDVLATLEELHALLTEIALEHVQIVVTVSPVPLQSTFSAKDIVVANQDSKASLRAAATQFAEAHDNVSYFPSYEMVMLSNTDLAWRADRVHVEPGMVRHVVDAFVAAYYEEGALSS